MYCRRAGTIGTPTHTVHTYLQYLLAAAPSEQVHSTSKPPGLFPSSNVEPWPSTFASATFQVPSYSRGPEPGRSIWEPLSVREYELVGRSPKSTTTVCWEGSECRKSSFELRLIAAANSGQPGTPVFLHARVQSVPMEYSVCLHVCTYTCI